MSINDSSDAAVAARARNVFAFLRRFAYACARFEAHLKKPRVANDPPERERVRSVYHAAVCSDGGPFTPEFVAEALDADEGLAALAEAVDLVETAADREDA